ncbi:hypothetical protein LCGC14_1120600 [marine sediment metagenome]|uniref:Damage-control phosphatase ARMT1-like metal-binding domain-containing protein n=1 Tax=marine sediment metagenome TaxID=412755 RepID=A0A0F9Q9U0_9ZZZZ|nr:DUF89 family protein [bacterium]
MKLEPECVGCIFNQMLNAFELLQPNISRENIIKAQKKLMNYLLNLDIHTNISPVLGKVAYNIISETLNEDDPYRNLKKEHNQLVLKHFKTIKKIIDKSKDPLFKAVIVSAIGNTIDFASQHRIDLISDIKHFTKKDFVINEYLELKQSLEKSSNLLIIGDNAGEIVFDKLLVLTIIRLYPEIEVVYSVRESPIINDATIEDAKNISLTDLVKVIESSATPGVDIDTSPEEFRKYFYQENGLILSKGQGNFESLYGIEVPNKDVYYLLKVKCNLMERIFRAKIGDLVLKKKQKGF